jgi:enterochelin esterase-like enzyme
MKRRLVVPLVGLAISVALPTFAQQKDTVNPQLRQQIAHAGQVLAFSFQSTTLGRDWPYKVYLPDGYDKSNLRYPVLFLLHGLNQDESTWVSEGKINEVADQLIAAGDIAPLLLVMPGSGDNWYVDTKEKIETAFVNDFIPEIERKFRILPKRKARGIGGNSMGGYGAFRFILKYPERFSVALLLAPSIFVPEPPANSHARQGDVFGNPFDAEIWKRENYPPLLDPFFAKNLPIALYFVAGDHDDYEIESQIGPAYKVMREHNFDVAMRIVSGTHGFSTWRPELPDALRFVCYKLSRPELAGGEQAQPGK